ncbi:hypothetical protein M0L20_27385 [Spirosoma sp. RP8]|uniref:Uncharacterized protein n=1 Tax=Spirosoma liriopis TaxID=2937440 RepID=A0ABT0HTW3_9BACT|nr:hypothetical protein [Spirosoma liriopis]MCK8495619.1 hypothetical protein [Spirosoma liriopis]
MIKYPSAVWTEPQLIAHLEVMARLFQSKLFQPSVPFTHQSKIGWIELIRGVSDLVRQAELRGKRICFTDEVGTPNQHQDITSLLDVMRNSAHVVEPLSPDQQHLTFISPLLNCVNGVGSGHFANGLFFICPYPNERAFFIGQDRIYFYRHLMRAYLEAGQYLLFLPDSN